MSEQSNGVLDAVKSLGSQEKLANAMGVTQQTVSYWVQVGYVPTEHVVGVSCLTGVPRQRLLNPKLVELVQPDTFQPATE